LKNGGLKSPTLAKTSLKMGGNEIFKGYNFGHENKVDRF